MSYRKKYDTGVIHGRFQVLHNDHIKYLLSGWELCEQLVIGITNPDPVLTREENSDLNRSAGHSNPLTYYERFIILRDVLCEQGLSLKDFSIVPFPVNIPELYQNYVPMDAVFFLSIYDNWGRTKLQRFKDLGLKIHILRDVPPEHKGLSSTDIREFMRAKKPWENSVPEAAKKLYLKWNIPERIIKMAEEK